MAAAEEPRGLKKFKKCKSAQFQLDGMLYTIGKENN